MRLGAQSAARSTNLAEPVVALLAALGTRIADVTETVTTDGPRARRLANVSRRLSHCRYTIAMSVFVFPSLGVLVNVYVHTHTGSHGGHEFRMSQVRRHREIRGKQLLRSQWCLVQKLRSCWKRQTYVVRGHPGMQNAGAGRGSSSISRRPKVKRGSN